MGLKKRKKYHAEDYDIEPSERAVKIAQHKHCMSCRKAVPPDAEHCSDACKAESESALKSRKMLVYVIYAMVAIMMGALVFQMAGFG